MINPPVLLKSENFLSPWDYTVKILHLAQPTRIIRLSVGT
jgi:hypothetical protein